MNRKKSKEDPKKKDTKATKKDAKEAKKDAKDAKREAKKVNKDVKKESKKDARQRKPSFISHTLDRSTKFDKNAEPEFEKIKRPTLMKSNSISGGERLSKFSSEKNLQSNLVFQSNPDIQSNSVFQRNRIMQSNPEIQINSDFQSNPDIQNIQTTNTEFKTTTAPKMLRRSMYHSEMELPRIDEDDREVSRRTTKKSSLTRRVSNLLRVTSDRLMGRSVENLSLSTSMQSLADTDNESLGGFVRLTRSLSVMLPKVIFFNTNFIPF